MSSPDANPAPRTPLNIAVDYRKSYGRDFAKGILKNISVTGAFLTHRSASVAVGEKLHLIFSVAGRERDIHATVVWTNSFGAGIKFEPQNQRDTQIIDDLIYFVETRRSDTRGVLDQILKRVG
jgi:hypothetical protein